MALGTQQLPYQNQQQYQKIMATQQRHLQQRTIAPAPPSGGILGHSSKTAHLYMPYTKPAYVNMAGTTLDSNNPSVVRRNARERNRVKQVNNGFVNLRQHIPQAIVADLSNGRRGGTGPGASKKLSKVDTLRMAVEYIRRLKRVIDEVDHSDSSSVSSYNSCSSGTSLSTSPSPVVAATTNSEHFSASWNLEQQQHPNTDFYALSFPQEQQQMISPAASTSSSTYSDAGSTGTGCGSASYFNNQINTQSTPLKYEPASYEEYPNNSNEDEELLDYISLWQEDM